MKRLNLFDFYRLGADLELLRDRMETTEGGVWGNILVFEKAQETLRAFVNQYDTLGITVSRQAVTDLAGIIEGRPDMMTMLAPGGPIENVTGLKLDKDMVGRITDGIEHVALLLAQELPTLESYVIERQGVYSTTHLLTVAENMFSEEIRRWLSAFAVQDLRQAGRALVMELYTAAGFHMLRATEAVIRDYYTIVVGTRPKLKHRNWGAYTRALTKARADTRIVGTLDQIRDLQRNPLMHPEVTLSGPDAQTVFGMSQGAIAAMVGDMGKRQPGGPSLTPAP